LLLEVLRSVIISVLKVHEGSARSGGLNPKPVPRVSARILPVAALVFVSQFAGSLQFLDERYHEAG
jgi:hypothetical protein